MSVLKSIKTAINFILKLDQRVFYSLLFRASQAAVGFITILMITQFFDQAEQGYYYTFNSILALQIIFEMGLSFIILQYTGHEFATIKWEGGRFAGPVDALSRFQAFFTKAVIAYGLIAACIFLLVWPAGVLFFEHSSTHIGLVWQLPWFFLCFTSAINIMILPFLSIIEGSGRVVTINQFKAIQNTLGALAMWLAMMGGAELYSIALDPLICFLVTVVWLRKYYSVLMTSAYSGLVALIRRREVTHSFKWSQEVWPMQWRIALSWISGYFLSQIYTPILFYYHDATSAGKFGASMAVCNMLSLFAITFLNAYNPEFCQLIASKKWDKLYAVFGRVYIQALVVSTLLAVATVVVFYLPVFDFITSRLLSPYYMSLLLLGTLISYMIGGIALFLRAFKREPFVWVSLIGASLNAILAWWFGRLYGSSGIVFTYFLLNLLFGLPTAIWIWRKNTSHLWKEKLNYGVY